MIRIRTTVILAALLLAGKALGQAPLWPANQPGNAAAPPANSPVNAPPAGPALAPPAAPLVPAPDPAAPGGAAPYDPMFWGRLSYLVGWVRGDPIPVLVSTSPAGTPQAAAGVFGNPGTQALFGGRTVNTGARSGFRLDLGTWLTPDQCLGVEAGFFILGGRTSSFSASSGGDPILARPFIDTTTGQATSFLVAYPGVTSGSIRASDVAHRFYGGNIDLRERVWATDGFRIDALLGYLGLGYTERLLVQQTVQPTGAAFVPGTTLRSVDNFAIRNIFNGVDVGFRTEFCVDSWFVDLTGKVAGGPMARRRNIAGTQVVDVPGAAPVVNQGGFLALPSNIGSTPRSTWTAVPQVAVNLGYQFSSNLRMSVGYWALFWLNAIRPGEQVDTFINSAQLPPATVNNAANPALINHSSLLWVQALTFNVEFRY